jgi:Lon protease-like protein
MPEGLVPEFPLFPLGIVALPGEAVPLHIFEPRYRAMIEVCLRDEREFGIVWMAEDGLREVGCACGIERILERLEDGRINLLARGTRVLRVVERQSHLAYPAGVVEFLTDEEETQESGEAGAEARMAYANLVQRATDRESDEAELASLDAYGMAATIDFGQEAKQNLLELRSEEARLRLLTRLLRAAIKRLDFVDRAQARARSNGKVRLG